jgi:septal ring factor EnvC (AmiA/AmiB activator)
VAGLWQPLERMTSLLFSILRVLLWVPLFLAFVAMIVVGFVFYAVECASSWISERAGEANERLGDLDQALACFDDSIRERSKAKQGMARRIRELETELSYSRESERAAWKHAHDLESEACTHGEARCSCRPS